MRKTFSFEVPNVKPPRVVESIKHDVRKYLKRERRKKLPDEADFWDFDCRVGKDADSSAVLKASEIVEAVDKAAAEGWSAIYIEILAKQGHREPKAPKPPEPDRG